MTFQHIEQLGKFDAIGAQGTLAITLQDEMFLKTFEFGQIDEVNFCEYGFAGYFFGEAEKFAVVSTVCHIPFFLCSGPPGFGLCPEVGDKLVILFECYPDHAGAMMATRRKSVSFIGEIHR